MCKGGSSQLAFMIYTLLALRFKINVVLVNHIAGASETMAPIDALSRGLPVQSLEESSKRVHLKGLTVGKNGIGTVWKQIAYSGHTSGW